MSRIASTPRYRGAAIALHWIVALLIFAGWTMGSYMADLKLSPEKVRLVNWHKWIGVTVLLLACLRLAARAMLLAPAGNPAHPVWQRRLSTLAHRLLYVLMFALPLSGWTYSSAQGYTVKYFGLIALPDLVEKNKALAGVLKQMHELLAWTLVLLVTAHVAGALWHHIVDRDDTLTRMLPIIRPRPPR